MESQILSVTTQETEKAGFADFEIVQDSKQTVRAISPWFVVRLVLLGMIGLALLLVVLVVGVVILIPFLIFIAVVRIISSLFLTGRKR